MRPDPAPNNPETPAWQVVTPPGWRPSSRLLAAVADVLLDVAKRRQAQAAVEKTVGPETPRRRTG
jgi:hypothetical protein